MRINGVLISEGNRKLGAIPSVSLLPALSCGKGCGKLLCMKDCYAMRMLGYTSVEPSWTENFYIWDRDPELYMEAIHRFLLALRPDRFRWHVGGDIPDADYLERMIELAVAFPETRFRAFTKAYNFLPPVHPKVPNLKIGISHWPNMNVGRELKGYTHSWLVPKQKVEHYSIPRSAHPCPGNCESCDMCWSMRAGTHVKFEQH